MFSVQFETRTNPGDERRVRGSLVEMQRRGHHSDQHYRTVGQDHRQVPAHVSRVGDRQTRDVREEDIGMAQSDRGAIHRYDGVIVTCRSCRILRKTRV